MKRILRKKVYNLDKLSEWAKKVKARDKFKCIACGYTGYLHSHHILPKSKHPKYMYSVMNGVTLCYLCHMSNNGVHGNGSARNITVAKLRQLVNSDFSKVKLFLKSLISKN